MLVSCSFWRMCLCLVECMITDFLFGVSTHAVFTHTHCIQVLARQSEGMGMGSTGWMMSVAMEMSQP